jgi:hypothetical protein
MYTLGKQNFRRSNHREVCYYQFIDLLKKEKGKKKLEHLAILLAVYGLD